MERILFVDCDGTIREPASGVIGSSLGWVRRKSDRFFRQLGKMPENTQNTESLSFGVIP
jgi:hypothetical protein